MKGDGRGNNPLPEKDMKHGGHHVKGSTFTEELLLMIIVRSYNKRGKKINAEKLYAIVRDLEDVRDLSVIRSIIGWTMYNKLVNSLGLYVPRIGKDKVQFIQRKWIDSGDAVFEKKNLKLVRIPRTQLNVLSILGDVLGKW